MLTIWRFVWLLICLRWTQQQFLREHHAKTFLYQRNRRSSKKDIVFKPIYGQTPEKRKSFKIKELRELKNSFKDAWYGWVKINPDSPAWSKKNEMIKYSSGKEHYFNFLFLGYGQNKCANFFFTTTVF